MCFLRLSAWFDMPGQKREEGKHRFTDLTDKKWLCRDCKYVAVSFEISISQNRKKKKSPIILTLEYWNSSNVHEPFVLEPMKISPVPCNISLPACKGKMYLSSLTVRSAMYSKGRLHSLLQSSHSFPLLKVEKGELHTEKKSHDYLK